MSQRRLGLRILRVGAVVLSALLLLTTGGGYLAYRHLNGNIQHISVPLPKKHGKTVNYLIIGSDNRQVAGGLKYGRGHFEDLSDTVILAHLSGDGKSARMVSFPRDGLVDIPACKRWNGNTGTSAPRKDKFNVAYSLGGPACTIKLVESMTGITIDDFIVVSLPGFVKISNALGGVEVCLPQDVADKDSKLYLSAGRHKIKGETALAYVRERKQLGGSRIRRQQAFMGSAIKEATSSGLLTNPPRLFHLLDVTTKSVITGNLSLNDLRKLADRFQRIKPGNVTFYSVPVSGSRREHLPGYGNAAGVYVDIIDDTGAKALYASIKASGPLPAPTSSATAGPPLIVPASRVHVQVLNGTGVKGAANKAAADLRAAGFDVVGTGDADNSNYTQTIVRFGPEKVQSSETLSAAVPGATRLADDGLGRVIHIIIGSNYTGAHSVSVSSSASPAPSTSPGVVTGVTADEDPCVAANGGGNSA
jgi:LCP family protein required for cell wall assembly